MKEVAELLNAMRDDGVIKDYALFGAVAQLRYTQPATTLDVDVLVDMPPPERLDVLKPIFDYCALRGFQPEGEAIRVGLWPVQFIPVFNEVTRVALQQAETADFEGTPLRVVSADYLALIALSTGRAKDWTRILALLESGSVKADRVSALAGEHGQAETWKRFAKRFLDV